MPAAPTPHQEAARLRTSRDCGGLATPPGTAFDEWAKLGGDLQKNGEQLHQFVARLDNLTTGVEQGKGTTGKLLTYPALADEAQKLLTRASEAMGELRGVGTNLNAETFPAACCGVSQVRLGRRPAGPVSAGLGKPRVESTGLAPGSSAGERAAFNAAAANVQKGAAHLPELTTPLPTSRRTGAQELQTSEVAERFAVTT